MLKRISLSLVVIFLSGFAFAQGARYEDHPAMKQRADGALVPVAATIAVCTQPATTNSQPCSPLATLYTDATLATPCTGTLKDGSVAGATNCSNPLVTDSKGNYHFYAGPGAYTLQVYGSGLTTSVQPDVSIPGAAGVYHVGGSATGDLGTQVNNAYTACQSSHCHIIVDPPTGAAGYSFSTPIVFATSGKFPLLECDSSSNVGGTTMSGTVLNYTPTTATTALTLDYATTGAQGPIHGVRNCHFINNGCVTTAGCGSSATGISNGTTNTGFTGALMDNVGANGFGVGFSETNTTQGYTASNVTWINPQFIANTTAMKIHVATGFTIHGGTIAGNANGIVGKTNNSTAELALFGVQFFGNSGLDLDFTAGNVANGTAVVNLYGVHIERTLSNSAHSMDGVFDLRMFGGLIEDNNSTGTTDRFINTGGNNYFIEGTLVTSNRTTTTVVVANTPARGKIEVYASSANISTLVTGANSSKFTTLLRYPGGSAVQPQTNESVQLGPNGAAGAPTYSFSGFTNSGMHSGGNGNTTITSGGVDLASFGAGTTGIQITTGGAFNWASGALNGALDTALSRSAAGVVAVGTTGGGNSAGILKSSALLAGGTAATFTGSTGACSTQSTQSGGAYAGRVTCTAATAASTLVIVPGFSATNGWICTAFDQTTRANLLQQTATGTTSCTLTATSITQNDVIVFQAIAF